MLTLKLSIKKHGDDERMFAQFPYDKELNNIVREVPGARLSNSNKQWMHK